MTDRPAFHNRASSTEGALSGIRVLDLSHVLAGPTATMILGDLGAEVIHIEPPQGDDAREYGPFIGQVDKDHSGYFISLNRNKKSMVLNLRHEKGKEILRELIEVSDVIIENYRPGTMRNLGFAWEEVQLMNPRIIYASISGFGHDTLPEYSNRPSYDVVAQAYSGLMSLTGPEQGPPCRVGSSIGDIIAGHQAAIGILAALFHRTVTGKGQRYDGSMVDGLFSTLENAVVRYTSQGEIPQPLGTAHPSITPFQAFPAKDNWIVIAIGTDKLWARFCAVIGRDDLAEDQRFLTNPLRTENRDRLASILTAELGKRTAREWADILEKEGIPCSLVNNIKQICEDPQVQFRNMLVEVEQPGVGKVRIAGSPFHLSETPGRVYHGAPSLGEHTEAILTAVLKKTLSEVSHLQSQGVIN
jgi:CoA:oxalate CoA-transferase